MESAMSALVCLTLLGAIATLTRLAVSGLRQRYFWFSVWASSNILKSAAIAYLGAAYGNSSHIYIVAWQVSSVVTAVLLAWAGVEAYLQLSNDYPTMGAYGRRALVYSSLAAIFLALIPIGMDNVMDRLRTSTLLVSVLVRSTAFAVAIGLLLAIAHLRSVRIPERKNHKYHRWLMIAYCIGNAAGMTMLVITEDRAWAMLYMGTGAACWCLWAFLLTGEGEAPGVEVSARERTAVEDRWTGLSPTLEALESSRRQRT